MQRTASGQSRLTRLIVGVSVVAALVAVAPIAGAMFGMSTKTVGRPSTAFADAPAGNYAVVTRNEGEVDILSVIWAENPSTQTEIARVPHLDGYTSTGAVSPDGTRVALVTVDAGTPSRPVASLLIANLETGELSRTALNVEPMQTPAWYPDGRAAAVTRVTPTGIDVVRVGLDATETVLTSHTDVLGVYPLGFGANGELLQVVIDGRGSVVQAAGSDLVHLGEHITRDWQLSPDASRIAFIEVNTDEGVRYLARTVSLAGGVQAASREALQAQVSALGVAWDPASGTATYGLEPAERVTVNTESLMAAGAAGPVAHGFDVPLAYSDDGEALALVRWSGASFDNPGEGSLQVVTPDGRATLGGQVRFVGWSAR